MRAGIDIGRAYNEGVERKRLEGIRTAAPEMSQGYTAEQGQQLEAMASAINPETGRPYYNVQVGQGGNYSVTPDFTEAQTPRTGMDTGSQYGVANVELQPTGLGRAGVAAQPIPFNQQRVTDFLGRRFEGELTPDRIEAMRSRAMAEGLSDPRQRQAALAEATRAEREAEEAPLRQEALRTQVAAGKLGLTKAEQDIETGALTLEQQKRTAAELQRGSDFAAFAAERPDATVAELKDAAFKQFKFTPKQWQDTVTTRLGIENAEMDSFKNNIKKKLQGKSLAQIGSIYNSDPDFDDKSDLAIVPGKGGAVTLNFIDKATNTITSSQSFKNEALATEYLNKQATEPETIGSWMMNLRKAESTIEAQGAAADKDRALGDRYRRDGETEKGLSKKVADVEASLGRKLSEPEKLTLFGLSARPSNRPEFTPKDYAATISSFVNAGLSPVDATIRADELYGRAPPSADVDAGLRQQDEAKKKGTPAAPIEVQPGERYMTAPGAAVRGPLNQFLRESRRGLFGGVEYFYTDPLTGRRYTTEQYNQLQNQ
jgi:hypothetical protein